MEDNIMEENETGTQGKSHLDRKWKLKTHLLSLVNCGKKNIGNVGKASSKIYFPVTF